MPHEYKLPTAARRLWPLAIVGSCGHLVLLCIPIPLFLQNNRLFTNLHLPVFLLLAFLWSFFEGLLSLSCPTKNLASSHRCGLATLMGIAILLSLWAAIFDPMNPNVSQWGFLAGSILILVGVSLRLASIRRLGPYFLNEVSLLPCHALVTTGVYSWLRHPSETGTLLLSLGAGILFESPLSLTIFSFILLPLVILRTKAEDQLLASEFQNDFKYYAQTVPALIPCGKSFSILIAK